MVKQAFIAHGEALAHEDAVEHIAQMHRDVAVDVMEAPGRRVDIQAVQLEARKVKSLGSWRALRQAENTASGRRRNARMVGRCTIV